MLGVDRVVFLDYRDSGMMGESTNDNPASFWQADLPEAAGKLAEILREENADLLITYDDNGGYGHPDHIQVHRVGARGGVCRRVQVFEASFSREFMQEMSEAFEEFGPDEPAEDKTNSPNPIRSVCPRPS